MKRSWAIQIAMLAAIVLFILLRDGPAAAGGVGVAIVLGRIAAHRHIMKVLGPNKKEDGQK